MKHTHREKHPNQCAQDKRQNKKNRHRGAILVELGGAVLTQDEHEPRAVADPLSRVTRRQPGTKRP